MSEGSSSCGGWTVRVPASGAARRTGAARLDVQGSGTVDDWWRAVAAAAWAHADDTGEHVDPDGLEPPR